MRVSHGFLDYDTDIDVADLACFEGLFSFPEATSVLYHNFCIYHVDPPGHQVGLSLIITCRLNRFPRRHGVRSVDA